MRVEYAYCKARRLAKGHKKKGQATRASPKREKKEQGGRVPAPDGYLSTPSYSFPVSWT